MVNDLLLLSGMDIPFPQLRTSVHQPRIKEISLIGEEAFHLGVQFLTFSKNNILETDKNDYSDKSDFDIFIAIANDPQSKTFQENASLVLQLLFPDFEISFHTTKILLTKEEMKIPINGINFDNFKQILCDMFSLSKSGNNKKYNPADKSAEKIAEKFRKAEEKINKIKNQSVEKEKIAIFNRYVSILAVGLKKDINSLMNYTVYQLYDEYQRFKLKQDFDMYIKAKLAGASDVKDVEDWMKDIHI